MYKSFLANCFLKLFIFFLLSSIIISCSNEDDIIILSPPIDFTATYTVNPDQTTLPMDFILSEGESVYFVELGIRIEYWKVYLNYSGDGNHKVFIILTDYCGSSLIEYNTSFGVFNYYYKVNGNYKISFTDFNVTSMSNRIKFTINGFAYL